MLTIRPATTDDVIAALDLLAELFAPPGSQPSGYTSERGSIGFAHAIRSHDADILLAVEDGAIVGLASVYALYPSMRFGRRCWLEDLVVSAARRRRGIGHRLLDAATAWARAHGCAEVELSSAPARTDAHRFYLANGMAQSMIFHRAIEGG